MIRLLTNRLCSGMEPCEQQWCSMDGSTSGQRGFGHDQHHWSRGVRMRRAETQLPDARSERAVRCWHSAWEQA